MGLAADLKNKNKFIITAELNPPKSTDLRKILENASKIKDLVSAINITDMSGASLKMCSMAVSYLLQKEVGLEAIWQITCRDRNRLALQSDLLGGVALGLKNLLLLKGDDPKIGDHPETSQSFDLQTDDLLKAIANLKIGKDLNGNEVKVDAVPVNYCVGAAAHPGLPDLKKQKEGMQKRLDLGVDFFQTQICFEKDQIDKFIDAIGDDLASKTILGITPLKTIGQAKFMNENIFGVNVPSEFMEQMQSAIGLEDPKSDAAKIIQQEMGLKIAKSLVDHIKKTPLKGVHIMAIGQEAQLDKIIRTINTNYN